jgi:hypothetical protein
MLLEKLAAVNSGMQMDEAALQGLLTQLAQMRMLRLSPSLQQVADTAAFLASDREARSPPRSSTSPAARSPAESGAGYRGRHPTWT